MNAEELTRKDTRPLPEVVQYAVSNCYLQSQGVDVAIPYICGAPGAGKTASVYAMCKANDWGLISTHFAIKPLEELGGIPKFKDILINGEEVLATIWSLPDIFRHLYEECAQKKMVIWFLDDIHLMSAQHNALCYEIFTERKLREYSLPDNCAIILAGNHASNKAGSKTMFSAIINRVQLMPVHATIKGWKQNFAIANNVHPAIMSFLEHETYTQFFHEAEQVETPWGSPRSWTRLSNMISALESWNKKPLSASELAYLTGGLVSQEATSEFVQYYSIFMKFDVPTILATVDTYKLPEEMVNRYALAHAVLSHFAGRKDRAKIVDEFAKIIYKYVKEHQDLALMIIHEILEIEKTLNKTNLFGIIFDKLNKIDPGIADKLLEDVTSV